MKNDDWLKNLNYNPITKLLASGNEAIIYFTNHDLLNKQDLNCKDLWRLPEALKIFSKQQSNGGWIYPGGNHKVRTFENYNQLETFRQLGFLIEKFGLNREHNSISNAAEYLFSFQSKEGDIRGILGNQYSPYYTAAIVELLIKAGYQNDSRITKVFNWLKEIRQNDGGWAIPIRTTGRKLDAISMDIPTIEPDKTKPSSHLVTGIVLRAYAAHDKYKNSPESNLASKLLVNQLFKTDTYPDRKSKVYWLKFTFPFWFTDLISAMDSLSLLGHTTNEPNIQKACEWFIENQKSDGTWQLKILKNLHNDSELWLSLAICRILKRLYN